MGAGSLQGWDVTSAALCDAPAVYIPRTATCGSCAWSGVQEGDPDSWVQGRREIRDTSLPAFCGVPFPLKTCGYVNKDVFLQSK